MIHESAEYISEAAADSLNRLKELIADLSEDQLMGPYVPTVNPMRWEIGHASWFYSYWVLRHAMGRGPSRSDEDDLFNSVAIAHTKRWILPLPSVADTVAYCDRVHDDVREWLATSPDPEKMYYALWSVFHEDMHGEAFMYMRQSLGYPVPQISDTAVVEGGGALPGDVDIPGGEYMFGASKDDGFVFDNEKWGHVRRVEPFSIARAAVSQGEFAEFVDDGGYSRQELWSPTSWAWRLALDINRPLYWKRDGNTWLRRHFDQWVELAPHKAMIFLSAHEAEAYCRWADRRLPTELEWEVAATAEPDGNGGLSDVKRRYPWGDEPPTPARANVDSRALGCVDVGALPDGDSAFGCRQMIGNVWEWTASPLEPFPGFVPDMYDEYAAPWFHSHRALKGGAFTTRGRMIRNAWRNFYTANRRDILAGFRTCPLSK